MIKAITLEDYENKISSDNKIILLLFYAKWCGASRIAASAIERLTHEYDNGIIIGKVDFDAEVQLSNQLKINSTPTVLILKNGKSIDRASGAKPIAFYRMMIKKANEV